jgi:hypothetical protein
MLISNSKKFIFIHIDKNGGTSVRDALKKYHDTKIFFLISNKLDKILRFKIYNKTFLVGRVILNFINFFLPLKFNFLSYHHKIKDINIRESKKFFKFCIIRNPEERFYSLFLHNLRNNNSEGHFFAKKGSSYFLKKYIIKKKISKQVDYICFRKINLMDEIIVFDNLKNDFKRIANNILKEKINIKHLNKRQIFSKNFLLDDFDKKLLRKYYKEDFRLYNKINKNVIHN